MIEQILIDFLVFLVAPVLFWRALRSIVPMAVLPIMFGLAISIAASRFGFSKSMFGPSEFGETVGWVGVLMLAFSAGLETREMAVTHGRASPRLLVTAFSALALPFVLGVGVVASGVVDVLLAPPAGVSPWLGAAALGLCLAVSALPVLIGIVRELPRSDRPLGLISLRIAAIDDGILWSGLAVILAIKAGAVGSLVALDWRHGAAVLLFVAMAILRKPLDRATGNAGLPLAAAAGVVYLAGGAWATTVLGLHELLGAYFAGLLMPIGIVRRLQPELLGKVALFGFSPLYFGHRGISIDGSVMTPLALLLACAIFLVAALAKLAAVHLTPPDGAMPAMERTRLGILLQCKGLMEIVAASILLKAGIVTETSFAILITMAVVSTALTAPMFRVVSAAMSRRPAAVPAVGSDQQGIGGAERQ